MPLPIVSIVLGVLSLLCALAAIPLTIVPFVGVALAFLSPVLGIAGVVTGGMAMSRAKRDGTESGAAVGGLVTSIVGALFGLLIALSCGLCGACITTGAVQNPGGMTLNGQPLFSEDGGSIAERLMQSAREQSRATLALELQFARASCADGTPTTPLRRISAGAEVVSQICSIPEEAISALRRVCASAGDEGCVTASLVEYTGYPAQACARYQHTSTATEFILCAEALVEVHLVPPVFDSAEENAAQADEAPPANEPQVNEVPSNPAE